MTDEAINIDVSLAPSPELDEPGESVPQRELQMLVGGCCGYCGVHYSAREAVFSIFLGLKNAPSCLPCTSRRLEREPSELWSDVLAHIYRRECYLKAWREAERIDGVRSPDVAPSATSSMTQMSPFPAVNEISVAAEWDAGDMGCGELVMALRLQIKDLRGGDVIRVTATDPAAHEDLPAWCRLCGHTLVLMKHPNYWIRRKGD